MRLLHTGDWHIGKKINGLSMLEEQQAAFEKMLLVAKEEKVDGIVIAGDIYDRAMPATEAVALYNETMIRLNINEQFPIFAISGNHDSGTRLATGTPWFEALHFHLHTSLAESFVPVEWQNVQFFLLPYFEPFEARQYFKDESIHSIADAMKQVIAKMQQVFKPEMQQVLVTHFFVAGSSKSESETTLTVGGLDAVPADLLQCFDYVALGHLHYKDALKSEKMKYSGALLQYAISEVAQEKGVYIVDINEAGVKAKFIPISPLRKLEILEGEFQQLISPAFYQQVDRDHYFYIRLQDQEVIPNVMQQLRMVYPRILQMERVHPLFMMTEDAELAGQMESLTPDRFFGEYFKEVTGESLSSLQEKWLTQSMKELQSEDF